MSEKKHLVIVESPAKAKTIEKFLGANYVVRSCHGHVRDLKKGEKSVDTANQFAPVYVTLEEKKHVVAALKKEIKQVGGVYLATDDDREGEAISWHLCHALSLDTQQAKRIVFREITKKRVLYAVEHPRGIDLALVNAQQARRVLDRLVGFELSPLLWRKVRSGLSAGRVQSVAVRLIVENEAAISSFVGSSHHQATFHLATTKEEHFAAKFTKKYTKEQMKGFLEACKTANFSVKGVEKKRAKRNPPAPLTTSHLQQEAHRQCGYAVGRTMRYAQGLYEAGKITYMRTDSTHLSSEALAGAGAYITETFGAEYSRPTQYKTKSKSAQEAHEAIRPTSFSVAEAGQTPQEKQLYKLIRTRTLASQMAPALLDRVVVSIKPSTREELLTATGETMVFEGFVKLYGGGSSGDNQPLPAMEVGEPLVFEKALSREQFTRPPARYNEASLVKRLEEMGIGRPSTYAPTVETIQKRNYVKKESREGKERAYVRLELREGVLVERVEKEMAGEERNKLFSTDEALIVTEFLSAHFPKILDYSFTASMEDELDEIAAGRVEWQRVIENFYTDFHPQVAAVSGDKEIRAEKSRLLGQDPASKKNVYARLGRYGPYVQLGEVGEKPQSASLRKDQLISNLTLEEALVLFQLPRALETWQGEPLVVSVGRFGPYIKHGKKFYSLGADHDPYTITQAAAIACLKEKIAEEKQRVLAHFEVDGEALEVLRGRYGPYIRHKGKNYRIPKGQRREAEHFTQALCEEIVRKAPKK